MECYKFHDAPDTIVLLNNTTTESPQNFRFNLHKVYLKNSPFFKTMFKKQTFKESFQKENVIVLKNLDESAVKNYFLGHFLKTQTNGMVFTDMQIENCIELRRVADFFNDLKIVDEIDEFIKKYLACYRLHRSDPNHSCLNQLCTSMSADTTYETCVSLILPLLSVDSKILTKAVATFIATNSKIPETQVAVVNLPPDLLMKVLAYFETKLAMPEINLQALIFRYLGNFLKTIHQTGNPDESCKTALELIKTAFKSCKVSSEVQRRLLRKFDGFFEKFNLHKELVDLLKTAENCTRMNWFVVKSSLVRIDPITNTVELNTRDRARVTIQTSCKMSMDCNNTYYEIRILEGMKSQQIAFAVGCVNRKFNHRNRQRDRFAEQEDEAVGWRESYGYHSDNGGVYECTSTANKILSPFEKGDVVGCGRLKDYVIFTRNGKYIHKSKLKNAKDNVYPAITFDQPSRKPPGEKHAKIYLLAPNEYLFDIKSLAGKVGYSGYTYDSVFQKYVKNEQAIEYYLEDGTDEVKVEVEVGVKRNVQEESDANSEYSVNDNGDVIGDFLA